MYEITIKTNQRGRYFIHAGVSRLSGGFDTREAAKSELRKRAAHYEYWAGSIGVRLENHAAQGKTRVIGAGELDRQF